MENTSCLCFIKGFVLTGVTFLLFQQIVAAQQKFSTKVSGKGIEIGYNDKTRFTGGKPRIENKTNDIPMMAVFNAADADKVSGKVSPSEINGLKGESFAVYELYSKELSIMKMKEENEVILNRMGCKYFNFVPIQNGVALIGLVNKYNAPKTILSSEITKNRIEVHLIEGETLKLFI